MPTHVTTLLLFMIASAFPGAAELAAQIPIAQMYHRSWTHRDGAPDNIEDMIQGSDGFLWLTTDDGLYRFDGVSFERYAPSDGSAFLSDHFSEVSATSDGSIWVSYLFGGLTRIKDDRITNFTEREGLRSGGISNVVEDQSGSFWAGGAAGVQLLTNSKATAIGIESGMPVELTSYLSMDNEGNLWVPLPHSLMVLPRGTKQFRAADISRGGAMIFCRPSIHVGVWCSPYAGQNAPVSHFTFSDGKAHKTLVAEPFVHDLHDLMFSRDGTVWMSSQAESYQLQRHD
jgi:ligand-binding sensor domain-containing protein